MNRKVRDREYAAVLKIKDMARHITEELVPGREYWLTRSGRQGKEIVSRSARMKLVSFCPRGAVFRAKGGYLEYYSYFDLSRMMVREI